MEAGVESLETSNRDNNKLRNENKAANKALEAVKNELSEIRGFYDQESAGYNFLIENNKQI